MNCIYLWTRRCDRDGEDFLQFIVAAKSKKQAVEKIEKRFGGKEQAAAFFLEATDERFSEKQLNQLVER